jgi:dTDP-4-amino-4,6-dideoxygalactose transaminase
VIDEKVFGATRNEVFENLAKNNIHARKYFYPLTSAFDCFHGKYDIHQTPMAVYISNRVLTIPMYADLDLEDVRRISKIIVDSKH